MAFNICGATTDTFRVRVSDLGRGRVQHAPREYDVAPGTDIASEWAAIDRYALECNIPSRASHKRISAFYSRFHVAEVK